MHDPSALYDAYPDVIATMPQQFTSHEFILELARRHQVLYVEALYAYRDSLHRGQPAPFRALHSVLARHLNALPNLVRQIASEVPSTNIFGEPSGSAKWERVE